MYWMMVLKLYENKIKVDKIKYINYDSSIVVLDLLLHLHIQLTDRAWRHSDTKHLDLMCKGPVWLQVFVPKQKPRQKGDKLNWLNRMN